MKRLITRVAPLAACFALAVLGTAAAATTTATKSIVATTTATTTTATTTTATTTTATTTTTTTNEFSGVPSPTGQPVPAGFTDLQNLCTLSAVHNSCTAVAPTVAGEPSSGAPEQLIAIGRPDLYYVLGKHPNSCDGVAEFVCAARFAGYSVSSTPTLGAMMLIPTGSTIQYADGTVYPASPDNIGLIVTQLLPNGQFVAAGALATGNYALVKIAAVTAPANASLKFVPYAPSGDKLDAFGDLYNPYVGLGFLDGLVTKVLVRLDG